MRRELNLDDQELLIGIVVRFTEIKNHKIGRDMHDIGFYTQHVGYGFWITNGYFK